MDKIWCIYAMEHYSALKKKKKRNSNIYWYEMAEPWKHYSK